MDMDKDEKERIFEFLDVNQFRPIKDTEEALRRRFILSPEDAKLVINEWSQTYFERHPKELSELTAKLNQD